MSLIVMPSGGIRSVEWTPPDYAGFVVRSGWTGKQTVGDLGGVRAGWQAKVDIVPGRIDHLRKWQAWASLMRGPVNTTEIDAVEADQPVFPTSVVVYGGGQTGFSLITSGWPTGTLAITAGQMVSVAGRLYVVTTDASTATASRAAFNVSLAAPGVVAWRVAYTGLVTRADPYNSVGSVLVDGTEVSAFSLAKAPGVAHPTGTQDIAVSLAAGTHRVELVWPYGASMDLVGALYPTGTTVAAPTARPTKRIVFFGDSRVHGFNASKSTGMWPFKAALAKSAQLLDLGYGGRQIVGADGTTAGALGCDAAVYLAGYNNFYPNGANITAVQALYAGVISNYRAAATSAGFSASKLVMLSDLDAPEAYGSGTYAANSPTLQAFRNALSAAVTASGDANCVFLSGNTGGMPTGLGSFPDGVHPNDAAATTIAGLVAAVLP